MATVFCDVLETGGRAHQQPEPEIPTPEKIEVERKFENGR